MGTTPLHRLAVIALVGSPLAAAPGQERSPIPPPLATDWRISFGRSWGSVHENIVRYTVTDRGQLAYVDRRGAEPAIGRISTATVRELTGLVDRLRLREARQIPSSRFNACIVSQHLPNVWFAVRRGNATQSLTHCNSAGTAGARDEYTLELDAEQKAVYRTLRAKLESLFDAELKAKVGTRQQTPGDSLSGVRCLSSASRADATAKGQPASSLPPECRSVHACALVPPMEIRSVTGRDDVANYAPEPWQSDSSSDCFHRDFVISVRLMDRGWTAERLEVERTRTVRQGYHVQSFAANSMRGYTVSHAPMVAMTGPYSGETAFLLVGEKLVAISVQTFPEDYLEHRERDSSGFARRGNIAALAIAAAARLPP